MTIRDQNRSRKVYSFYRAKPVPLEPLSSVNVIVSGSGGASNMLIFDNISALSAHNATGAESGQLAFVKTVRDYFFIEKTVNTGSIDNIENVTATGGGVWHRMYQGGGYWKRQLTWYVNADTGNDENIGASDSPLLTVDEFVRRFAGEKIVGAYTINLVSTATPTTNGYGLDVEFDGGMLTIQGVPAYSASMGTITALSGAVNYASSSGPYIRFSGATTPGANNDLLYSYNGATYTALGWVLDGDVGTAHTTAFSAGLLGNTLNPGFIPTLNSPGAIARGRGDLVFNSVKLGYASDNFILGCDFGSPISLTLASIESNMPEFVGGLISLERSRVRSTSGSVMIHNASNLYVDRSAFLTPQKQVNIRDSHVEFGSSVFFKSNVKLRKSQLLMVINGSSGSALLSSTIEAQSATTVDVRNLIASRTNGLPWAVSVTGQDVSIFYDDVNVPKANNVVINNGFMQNSNWASMPYSDLLRNTKIVSGSLRSVLNNNDESY